MSKIMVLQTESNQMIGFLLFASEKPVFCELGWEGHCIFTGAPKDPSVLDNELCEYLQNHKNVEFNAKVIRTGNGYSLIIKRLLSAELSGNLKGTWSPADREMRGFCFIPSEEAP